MCPRCSPHSYALEQQFVHALHDWSVKAIAGDVNHAERGVGVFPDAALEESFPVHVVGRRPGSCTPVSMLCDKYPPRSHRVGLELISMILFAGMIAGMIATGGVAQADELVVDNADATVQVTGRWAANSVSPGFYGGDYLFHLPGDGASTVTWTFPATGVAGRYAVFARWSSGPNRTGEATYVVISDTDKARVRVSQRTGGGQWYGLGSYTFRPNARQGVTLSDRADGVVVADAIVWVGPLGAGDMGIRPADVASARQLQRAVDAGDEPWRLDPLEAARADAVALGLSATDPFQLVSADAGVARVRAHHGQAIYHIRVVQPARLGPTGIWIVDRVSRIPAE